MGAGKKHQKKTLCFRALKNSLSVYIKTITDLRQNGKIIYSLHDAYLCGFAMFFLQDKSLLEFQRRFQKKIQKNNLATVFDIEEVSGFEKLNALESFEYSDKKGKRYVYEWVNDVALNGQEKSVYTNFVRFSIYSTEGKRTYHSSWVTDIAITACNVQDIVRGGRARWKIENETFNTLKNHGYHLEHNFGHAEKDSAPEWSTGTPFGRLLGYLSLHPGCKY